MNAIASGTSTDLYGISMGSMYSTDSVKSAVTAVGASGVVTHSTDEGLSFTASTGVTTVSQHGVAQIDNAYATVTCGNLATLLRVGFDSCGGCSGQGKCVAGVCVCDSSYGSYAT